MFVTKALFAAAAVAASAAVVTPAMAQDSNGYRTAYVSYADLDLGSAAGVSMLKSRIRAAAYEVCGTAAPMELRQFNEAASCRSDAIENAGRVIVTVLASLENGQRLAALDSKTIAVSGQ